MSDVPDMVFHVPEDALWLQAFGRVAIVHAHLDHILRMTIKTLATVATEDALAATERESSSTLRDRIRKLAKIRLGEGEPLLKLQALVERCRRATEKRNLWIHGIVTSDWLGDVAGYWKWEEKPTPLPTVSEMDLLTEQMHQLMRDLNFARMDGWLAAALSARPQTKPAE